MGLDMYLTKRTYVKNWDHQSPQERHTVTVTGPAAATIQPDRVSEIIEDIAYWRKANAIHQWFVTHCQDGVDDCREVFVPIEQVRELVKTCAYIVGIAERQCVDWHKIAAELLPVQSGCFFGTTAYDDDYLDTLRATVERLTPFLDEDDGFYYRASW